MPQPQTPRGARGLGALTALARGGARLNRLIGRGQTVFRRAGDGFLTQALSANEMTAVTVALYELDSGGYRAARGLSEWERAWYAELLPPAPAALLLTAAGQGREVVALREMGYAVDAFEPVAAYAAACRSVNSGGDTLVAGHADFCRAVLDDGGGPTATLKGRTYDAVILSWGSFTHVIEVEEQRRVLRAAVELSPRGPVLASFFARSGDATVLSGRAHDLGAVGGRALRRWRGAAPAPLTSRSSGTSASPTCTPRRSCSCSPTTWVARWSSAVSPTRTPTFARRSETAAPA